jgi:hypothetical protein
VLRAVRTVIKPGGLFFVGQWGGESSEGLLSGDDHKPPRFFSFRTDREIFDFARDSFEVVDFHAIEDGGKHFQSLTLVRPSD